MQTRLLAVYVAILAILGCAAAPVLQPVDLKCPLKEGRYTLTQGAKGHLSFGGVDPFMLPAGGKIVQDISSGKPPKCEHNIVIPAEIGFSMPAFCIPALKFNVKIRQLGCGAGLLDSNGGADFTVRETADTSDASATCSLPHAGCSFGADKSQRVDVIVGDGAKDKCKSSAGANEMFSVPAETIVWMTPSLKCPDPDGNLNGTDMLILRFPQIFDFTTDASSAEWRDIDGDGCCLAGSGPSSTVGPCQPGGNGALSSNGRCLDPAAGTVTLAASGTAGSTQSPLYDLTFTTDIPYTVSGPVAKTAASCAKPPKIVFTGQTTRCIP